MNGVRIFAKHAAIGAVSIVGVFTGVFAIFSYLGGDSTSFGVEGASELSQLELYRTLLWRTVTLDWGVATYGNPDRNPFAYHPGDAVLSIVVDAFVRTALYVVPALLLGITVAVLIGLYAALNPETRLTRVLLGSAYFSYGVPTFWIGAILLSFTIDDTIGYSPLVFEYILPVLLVSTTLVGGSLTFTRAYSLEYASAEFVALVEAKGARRLRIGWHILRNAAIPIFSMLFAEAFAVLVLSVFVIEILFGIEGIGLVLFGAANSGDLPVLLGSVMVIVAVGVVVNFLQDLSYGLLDPRVGDRS